MKLNKLFAFFALTTLLSIPLPSAFSETKHNDRQLTILADKYKTDKGNIGRDGSPGHLYTEIYENYFYPIKDDVLNFCEIGVETGASLRTFLDYFPNATYYGIDIEDKSELNSSRAKIFVADQADRQELQKFIDAAPVEFDIILDDGGHTMQQQQISFGMLFGKLKSGGYYIIEDVHTSLMGTSYGAEKNQANTTLRMIDRFIRVGSIESVYLTPAEEKYLTDNVAYADLISRNQGHSIVCIFKKK